MCGDFKAIQSVQNDLLRALNGTKTKDKVSIKSMLEKFNLMSVNQINAQIKLLEIWKSQKLKDYPLEVRQQTPKIDETSTRACTKGRLCELGKTSVVQNTCISDADVRMPLLLTAPPHGS